MAKHAKLSSEPRSLRYRLSHGMTIAADEYGASDGLPVLFLHGGGQTRHAWGGAASAIAAQGWRAITMDHRGHGESDWDLQGCYHVEDFVKDLCGVIDQLGEKPVLVGASIGGMTALMAEASAEASICRAIVFVDVTPRLEVEGVIRILKFMQAKPDGFASLEEAADAVAAYLPHRKRSDDTEGLKKNLRLGEDGRYRWHWDPQVLEVWDPKHYTPEVGVQLLEKRVAAVKKLKVPVLLIRGRLSDVVSEEGAREFLELAPHAQYVDLEGAAHMVAGDRNDVFSSAVVDFLEEHFSAEKNEDIKGA